MKNLSKIILSLLAATSLAACGGGAGGTGGSNVSPEQQAVNARYIASTSALQALAEGIRSDDSKDLYAAALNKHYQNESAKVGTQSAFSAFSSNAGDFAMLANDPSAEGLQPDSQLRSEYNEASSSYAAARNSRMFDRNTSLDWSGTYTGEVVGEDYKIEIINGNMGPKYLWVGRGDATLNITQSEGTLGIAFIFDFDGDEHDRTGNFSNASGFWYTRKNGNEVTSIAGAAQTGTTNNLGTKYWYTVSR